MKSDENIPDHPTPHNIAAALGKQRTVKTTEFKNWTVTLYFGPEPKVEGELLDRLGYTASATTTNRSESANPEPGGGATRINAGESSVVMWSGETPESITKEITKTFPQFLWEKETPNGK
jgi:hypothetical protein